AITCISSREDPMVEKLIMSPRNVIDLARYQQGRVVGKAQAFSTRLCRHCGAVLADGENEDECSSTFNLDAAVLRTATRKFYAE
ncbi:MAG: hypothetical protein ABUL53_13445, partial [Bradyrhizobium guangdongense]